MQVCSNLTENFGTYELDEDTVELHSINRRVITLPYKGSLPQWIPSESRAYLQICVQPVQGATLALITRKGGKKISHIVSASKQEIIDLMDSFFEQEKTGLDDFYCGYGQANYTEWRKIAVDYCRLLDILRALTKEERDYIFRHLELSDADNEYMEY